MTVLTFKGEYANCVVVQKIKLIYRLANAKLHWLANPDLDPALNVCNSAGVVNLGTPGGIQSQCKGDVTTGQFDRLMGS
jgi:hypothetical protein